MRAASVLWAFTTLWWGSVCLPIYVSFSASWPFFVVAGGGLAFALMGFFRTWEDR